MARFRRRRRVDPEAPVVHEDTVIYEETPPRRAHPATWMALEVESALGGILLLAVVVIAVVLVLEFA